MADGAAVESAKRTDQVMELLRHQAKLFARLEGFADRQRLLVVEEDPRPLLALLADRQKLSMELADIAARLAPTRREWAMFRASLGAEERTEADGLVDEAARRLRRVIDADEEDSRRLSMRRQMTGEALRTTRSTGEAISAYRAPTGASEASGRLDEAT